MANPNLKFVAGGRTRTLFKRFPGGPWYIRFMHQGKHTTRSLGTRDVPTAKGIARHLIDCTMRPLVCPTCKRQFTAEGEHNGNA